MTKARTAGAKRRAKKAPLEGVADLADIPKKQPNGRVRRTSEDRDKSVQSLKARCRQMGKEVTKGNIREARAPWNGCYAGRVIADEVMSAEERAELWDAICTMRRIVVAYDASIGAPRRHAVCLRLVGPTGGYIETTDEAERARLAQSRWMEMNGWLGYADKQAASEAKRVVLDDQFCTDRAGLLIALRCVSDGIKGRKMKYRGRS